MRWLRCECGYNQSINDNSDRVVCEGCKKVIISTFGKELLVERRKNTGFMVYCIDKNSSEEDLANYLKSFPQSYKERGHIGDKVYFMGLFSKGIGTVIELEEKSRTIETEGSFYYQIWLYDKYWLDRHGINKKVLHRVSDEMEN